MALRKIFTPSASAGFSLIEVTVVIAMMSIIASFMAFLTLGDYSRASFRSEAGGIVSALQTAREESMHGSCFGEGCTGARAHGVHLEEGGYSLFQGTAYSAADSLNEKHALARGAHFSGFTDVVFEPLSGHAAAVPTQTLRVADGGEHSSVITIGSEGRISWSN